MARMQISLGTPAIASATLSISRSCSQCPRTGHAGNIRGLRRFGIGEIGDSLHRFKVEFHPKAFVVRIEKAEGMTSEAVHLPQIFRDAANIAFGISRATFPGNG